MILYCQIDMIEEGRKFVAGHSIDANFANTEHVRLVKIVRNEGQHLLRQNTIFALFRIETEPAIMLDPILCRPCGLKGGQTLKVVREDDRRHTIIASPECRFADCDATSQSHLFIIVSSSRDHVSVDIYIFHLAP